jgi:hypothetical protein
MGDHFSGPRGFDDPAVDITDLYVFPTPGPAMRYPTFRSASESGSAIWTAVAATRR